MSIRGEAQRSTYASEVSHQLGLLIRWAGPGLEQLLDAVGLTHGGGAVELASARIEIDGAEPLPGEARMTVAPLPGPPAEGSPSLEVAAIGWATVDLDRAATEMGGDWAAAPDDRLMGASVRSSVGRNPHVFLLEPETEGRLAGALARYGEGPIALYLRVRDPDATAARVTARPGRGPLGGEWLVSGGHPAGPFVLLVGDPAPGDGDRVPSES